MSSVSVDADLVEKALEVSGEQTRKAVVAKALREFIARRQQRDFVNLMGKLEYDYSYNYKAERSRD